MISFSETELQCIGNALDRAADRYEADAKIMREAGQDRLAEQFDRQKVECYTLRERLAEVVGW